MQAMTLKYAFSLVCELLGCELLTFMYNTEQCSLYLLCYTLYPGTYFYLVTGNLCLFTVFIQFPSPHSLSLIITASVISFSMSLVYLFVFEVQLTHNTMLVPSARCSSDLIFLYVSK